MLNSSTLILSIGAIIISCGLFLSARPISKRSPVDQDGAGCSGSNQEENFMDFSVDDDPSTALELTARSEFNTRFLGDLVDGPMSRSQVQISSSNSTALTVSRVCQYGNDIDRAARNLYQWLTQDDEVEDPPVVQPSLTASSQSSERDDYCDTYDIQTNRRRISYDSMKNIVEPT